MNQNAKAWIRELKNTSYPQTKNTLRSPFGFCCLGIACEIYRKNTKHGQWTTHPERGIENLLFQIPNGLNQYRDEGLPPIEVWKWLGLYNANGMSCESNNAGFFFPSLTLLNDNGWTFKQIAELLESPEGDLYFSEPREGWKEWREEQDLAQAGHPEREGA